MKVKNIVFSGFAAAILATGASAADAPQIASRAYVDNKVQNSVDGLNTTVNDLSTSVNNLSTNVQELTTNLEENYTTNQDLNQVITTNITNALTNDNGELGKALAGKVDRSEVTNTMDMDPEGNNGSKIPNVVAVQSYAVAREEVRQDINEGDGEGLPTQNAVKNYVESVAVTREDVADTVDAGDEFIPTVGAVKTAVDVATSGLVPRGEVTSGIITDGSGRDSIPTSGAVMDYTSLAIDARIGDGLSSDSIADGAITTDKIENGAVTNDKLSPELQQELNDKVTDAQMKEYAIPMPPAKCVSGSEHCLLSVDTAGNLTWVAVTAPYDDAE